MALVHPIPDPGSIFEISPNDVLLSPENDRIYGAIDPTDPKIIRLAENMKEKGFYDPIVLTLDGWVLSGHRRTTAARLAGLKTILYRVDPINREDDIDEFIRRLCSYNDQRIKTRSDTLREEIVFTNPEETYQTLIEHRNERSQVTAKQMLVRDYRERSEISAAKRQMLDAIVEIVYELEEFWPISIRKVHYELLNVQPLRHASKPKSQYRNDKKSYSDLTDLGLRARIEHWIPWEAIGDETRPVTLWETHDHVQSFLAEQVNGFCKSYWRNLLQSQPNHIELIVEKNTVAPFARPVAMKYCLPMTSGRGFCSGAPLYHMAERYRKSGKEKFVVLILSDMDPDGVTIGHSIAGNLQRDHGFDRSRIVPVRVGLDPEHVTRFNLPTDIEAKKSSKTFAKFQKEYGDYAYELEALSTAQLQQILAETIDQVIDTEAFNHELDAEKQDSVFLQSVRTSAADMMAELSLADKKPD